MNFTLNDINSRKLFKQCTLLQKLTKTLNRRKSPLPVHKTLVVQIKHIKPRHIFIYVSKSKKSVGKIMYAFYLNCLI